LDDQFQKMIRDKNAELSHQRKSWNNEMEEMKMKKMKEKDEKIQELEQQLVKLKEERTQSEKTLKEVTEEKFEFKSEIGEWKLKHERLEKKSKNY